MFTAVVHKVAPLVAYMYAHCWHILLHSVVKCQDLMSTQLKGLCVLCSMSLKAMCQSYVLPLAGNPEHENYQWRWLSEPHFRELSHALHTGVCIHDVSLKNYCAVFMGETPSRSGIAIDLLFQGDHYEPLYS